MEEKIENIIKIVEWYFSNTDELEPLDALKGLEATMKFAEQLRPLYEKYNKVEEEGFKILARINNGTTR